MPPGTNFGWMLKNANEVPTGVAVVIASREATDITTRPTLTVVYTPVSGTITTFCDPADNNSTGVPTVLTGTFGSGVGSDLHLEVTSGPFNQFGYCLVGTKSTENGVAIGSGHLCLSVAAPNMLGRYNVFGGSLNSIGLIDAGGVMQNLVGTSTVGSGFDVPSTLPFGGNPVILTGNTWHFQVWHRENGGDSNLSNGVSATF